MFNKKDLDAHEGLDTIIGLSSIFSGNIESERTIRIDGQVNGDLKVTGDVFIGEHAQIFGNIECSNAQLSGKVEGNISAKGILRLLPTAKLQGNIRVSGFIADQGALFQGKCEMQDESPTETPIQLPIDSKEVKRQHRITNILEEVFESRKA